MKKITYAPLVAWLLLLGSNSSQAQQADTVAIRFSKYLTADGMKKNLTILASDEYEGRETGQKGQKMTAQYITNYYKDLGIPPINTLKEGYQQTYPLAVFNPPELKLSIAKKAYNQTTDYYSWANITGDTDITVTDIEFCGYGINTQVYNDYDKVDLKHKAVMILNGEPYRADGKSIISQSTEASPWATNMRSKQAEAKKQGIKYLFVVDTNIAGSYARQERRLKHNRMAIDDGTAMDYPFIIYISKQMADEILASSKQNTTSISNKISSTAKPMHFPVKTNIELNLKQGKQKVSAENVMAYIEGTDLKNEVLVLSAHYDHLGIQDGKVYNGADDDGSGTVAIMQLAKAFQEAKKQGKGARRSMLFLNVSGEEKGLLGSEYYTDHPVFELSKTICDLNIDMIGRLDEKYKNNANYVYLIGSDKLSSQLHQISEQVNKTYTNLQLDYTYNDEKDPNRFYYRSDHYNFAKNNVPVIFYFNGVHDDYHQPTDDVEKIDFAKMEKISKLVFFTAWKLANQTERIKVDSSKK
jgi:hypothetical protein